MYIVLLMSFLSCEMESVVEFDISKYETGVVVNGIISNEGSVTVQIYKTLPPLTVYHDSLNQYIQNAKVSLYEDDNFLQDLVEMENGIYLSSKEFKANFISGYSLKIVINGFPEVTTNKQYLPTVPELNKAIYYNREFLEFIEYEFCDDNLNEKYYYYKRIIYHQGNEDFENYFNPQNYYYKLFDPSNIIYGEKLSGKCLLGNSQIYSWHKEYINENRIDSIKADSVEIFIYSISRDLVYFLESISSYESKKDDIWNETPIEITSNIINGFGVFGAYSKTSKTISLK